MFYERIYTFRAVEHTKEEILDGIGKYVKKILEHDTEAIENLISMDEINVCFRSPRNNVSPGVSGFL